MEQNRRSFLKNSTVIAGAVCCGGVSLLTGCKSLETMPHTEQDRKIVIAKSDFGERQYALVKIESINDPILLSKAQDESYHAVLMRCTHKNCDLKPIGRILQCECHGSEFDQKGKVLEGPATEPLRKFNVEEDDQNIYIC